MKQKSFSQLYNLNREIEMYSAQLSELESNLQSGQVRDTVRGSCSAFPYTPCVVKVEGVSPTRQNMRAREQISETIEIITTLQDRAAIEYKRLLREISSAPDSLTRQILTYRYINGLPWAQVAVLVGGDNTPDGVRKIATRYILTL